MSTRRKKKSNERNQRHGAAWGGGRFLLLALILVANLSFAQNVRAVQDDNDGSSVRGKLAPDLAKVLRGSSSRSMRVIVQYNQAPGANHFAKAQSVGAKLNSNLSLVNAGAFTMSPAAIRALAMDGDVAFISPDRKLKGMDDYTDSAVGVSTAGTPDTTVPASA